ncbi:MAG: lysostaphin resistance A-like protein [Armatimonadota bacterium]
MRIALRSPALVWAVLVLITAIVPPPRRAPVRSPDSRLDSAAMDRWRELETRSLAEFDSFGGIRWESSEQLVRDWNRLARETRDPRIVRRATVRAVLRSDDDIPSTADSDLVMSDGGLEDARSRAAWRRWMRNRPIAGDAAVVARDLPTLLAKGVRAREADRIGDRDRADRLRAEVSSAASRRLMLLGLIGAVPLLVGIPLLLWTAVIASGKHRWTVVRGAGLFSVAAALGVSFWMFLSSGSPMLAAVWGAALLFPAAAVVGLAAFAAVRGRPAIACRVPDETTYAPRWTVAGECVLAYLGLNQGLQWLLAATGWGGVRFVVALAGMQVLAGLSALAYAAWRLKATGSSLRAIGVWSGGVPGDVVAGVLAWAMLVPATASAGFLARQLLGWLPELAPNPVLPLLTSPNPQIRVALSCIAVLGAPVFEECFFRGVLYTGLRAARGVRTALLVTGLAFAALHPLVDALPILVLSVGLALVRERRSSLLPAIVAHVLQNGTATIATLIAFG